MFRIPPTLTYLSLHWAPQGTRQEGGMVEGDKLVKSTWGFFFFFFLGNLQPGSEAAGHVSRPQ